MLRLSKKEINIIKETIFSQFKDAEIYIFGSRLKEKKGGDIDIFIITNEKNKLSKKAKVKFLLEEKLYKPVDIVIHKDFDKEIEKEAMKGVKL